MKINEALDKGIWHDPTPEFWNNVLQRRKKKRDDRIKK